MLFPSVVFLAWFAPLFLCVYFFLPWKNLSFFLFSLVFFFWGETKYIGVLLAYIAVNYLFGLLIGTRNTPALRRKWALAESFHCPYPIYCKENIPKVRSKSTV